MFVCKLNNSCAQLKNDIVAALDHRVWCCPWPQHRASASTSEIVRHATVVVISTDDNEEDARPITHISVARWLLVMTIHFLLTHILLQRSMWSISSQCYNQIIIIMAIQFQLFSFDLPWSNVVENVQCPNCGFWLHHSVPSTSQYKKKIENCKQ